jgi:hypothetical protein
LKELEDKMQTGQIAALTTKLDDLTAAKKAFQDYTIEMIREEVKGLRKKSINA